MCVSLLQMAGTTAIEQAGAIQAVAGGVNALGDLAGGVARARMNRNDARAERAYGQAKAGRVRAAGEQELGTARAAAAGAGVKVGSGSVMAAEGQIVRNVEQDAMSAILTGDRRADSLDRSAHMYQMGGLQQAGDGLLDAATVGSARATPGWEEHLVRHPRVGRLRWARSPPGRTSASRWRRRAA